MPGLSKSNRICQILDLLNDGLDYREIADRLNISYGRVVTLASQAGWHRQRGRPTEPPSDERYDSMADMASLGLTLQQIGDHFRLTRERVRQILNKRDIRPADFRPPKPQAFPIPKFRLRMYRWLREVGYQRCCHCGWQPECQFSSSQLNICRTCNAKRCFAHYRDNRESRLAAAKAYYSTRNGRRRATIHHQRWSLRHDLRLQGLNPEEVEREVDKKFPNLPKKAKKSLKSSKK